MFNKVLKHITLCFAHCEETAPDWLVPFLFWKAPTSPKIGKNRHPHGGDYERKEICIFLSSHPSPTHRRASQSSMTSAIFPDGFPAAWWKPKCHPESCIFSTTSPAVHDHHRRTPLLSQNEIGRNKKKCMKNTVTRNINDTSCQARVRIYLARWSNWPVITSSDFLDDYDDDRMLMEWASTTVEGGDEMRWVCSDEKIWANVSRPQNHPSSLMTGPEWEQPQEMDERLRVVPHSPEYIVYLVAVGQVFVTLFLRQTDVIGWGWLNQNSEYLNVVIQLCILAHRRYLILSMNGGCLFAKIWKAK